MRSQPRPFARRPARRHNQDHYRQSNMEVTIDPRGHGEKDIDATAKNFSAHIKNKGGHLGLTTGISLEVTTLTARNMGQKTCRFPLVRA